MTVRACKYLAIAHLALAFLVAIVAVLYLSGCARKPVVPPQPSISPQLKMSGPTIVTIHGRTTEIAAVPAYHAYLPMISVQKQIPQRFAWGVWTMPAGKSPTDFAYLASQGLTLAHVGYYGGYDANDWGVYLNMAQSLGMILWLDIGEELFSAGWDGMLAPVATHSNLGAVVAWDEPAWLIDRHGGVYHSPYYGDYTHQRYVDAVDAIIAKYSGVVPVVAQTAYFKNESQYSAWVLNYSTHLKIVAYDDYRWPEQDDQYAWQRADTEWMKANGDGKPVYAILQAVPRLGCCGGEICPEVCTPSRNILLAEAKGAKDGGAAGAFWWIMDASGTAIRFDSQLFQDAISVSKEVNK